MRRSTFLSASLCVLIDFLSSENSRLDRSRAKWRIKLQAAFNSQAVLDAQADKQPFFKSLFKRNKKNTVALVEEKDLDLAEKDKREGRSAKWILFMLPFITVLREGLEAVVFVAGVRRLPFFFILFSSSLRPSPTDLAFLSLPLCRSRSRSPPRPPPSLSSSVSSAVSSSVSSSTEEDLSLPSTPSSSSRPASSSSSEPVSGQRVSISARSTPGYVASIVLASTKAFTDFALRISLCR